MGALGADVGVAIRQGCQILPCGRAAAAAMLKGWWGLGLPWGGALMSGPRQSSSHRDGGVPVRSQLRSDVWRTSMCSRDM